MSDPPAVRHIREVSRHVRAVRLREGEQASESDARLCEAALVRIDFHARAQGLPEEGSVGGIDEGGGAEAAAVRTLHEVEHGAAFSGGDDVHEFPEMLLPADRGRVGEAGHAVFHERDVLALDPQGREGRTGKKGVQPALTPADLAPDGGIAFGEAEPAGEEGSLNHPVGN